MLAYDLRRSDSVPTTNLLLHGHQLVWHSGELSFCISSSHQIVAFSSGVNPRLFGISLASFSSGLGELTFLQLTTTLPTKSASKTALGAWSSGTGAAGIAGAGIWWILRGLGVKGGLGISSVSFES